MRRKRGERAQAAPRDKQRVRSVERAERVRSHAQKPRVRHQLRCTKAQPIQPRESVLGHA